PKTNLRGAEGELGAAAFGDPDASAVKAPRAVHDARVFAQLARYLDAETRVGLTPVPHVVDRLTDDRAVIVRRARHRTRAGDELRAAAVVDPHSAAVIAPRLSFHATALAQLPADLHAIAGIGIAVMPFAARLTNDCTRHRRGGCVVRRDEKISAAPVVDPDRVAAGAPRLSLHAGALAELAQQRHRACSCKPAAFDSAARLAADANVLREQRRSTQRDRHNQTELFHLQPPPHCDAQNLPHRSGGRSFIIATMDERIGPYRILRKLGEGGMGVVYAAEDERLRRTVAIKTIREAGDSTARERFFREARAAASLTHPNVCQIFDIGDEAGRPFLVMELLDGEPLSSRISRGALPLGDSVQITLAILTALDALHARGFIHRDLKPSNVFLTPGGVKLLDFGLAREMHPATLSANDTTLRPGEETPPLTLSGMI